ncbi:hypothetical protein, partial [Pseudomonas aeruginosa]|uniref:hypothetical protein n=1 Tax=Pseudomonas aeruginosa TaxID=287 RepID=UPI003BF5ECDF
IAYLPFGPLLRLTWGNGIALSREYDQDYQLLRQKVGPWQSDYPKKLCKLLRTSPENRGAPESQYYETKYVRENPMGAD